MRKLLFVSFTLFCFVVLAGCGPRSRLDVFTESQKDFERIVEILLAECEGKCDRKFFSLEYDAEGRIINICGVTSVLSVDDLDSINAISDAFTFDFSFIEVYDERVSFGGEGNEMYVYTLKNKPPKWFYAPDDGVDFSKEKLTENWYFLYNNIR